MRMPDYRLYSLDGTRRIAGAAEVLSADSDEEALAAARSLGKAPCEVWQGRRLVATLQRESRDG